MLWLSLFPINQVLIGNQKYSRSQKQLPIDLVIIYEMPRFEIKSWAYLNLVFFQVAKVLAFKTSHNEMSALHFLAEMDNSGESNPPSPTSSFKQS